MGLWETIKEITKDIFDDADIENKRMKQFSEDTGRYSRRNGEGYGFFKIALPNLIGFLVGLAVARLFQSNTAGYFILGIIFAVGIGTLEHTLFGGMNLKAAVIRNIIMVSFFCLMFALSVILSDCK